MAAAVMLGLGFALSPWRRLAVAAAMTVPFLFVVPACAEEPDPAAAQASQPAAAAPGPQGTATAPAPGVAWWQRVIPGGSRRLARAGLGGWKKGDLESAAGNFAGAAVLDPENPDRLYDLGTTLAVGGALEEATQLLARAHEDGVPGAAYNSGTASLKHQQAELAVQWLRRALLRDPNDPDTKRNYELALRLLEQQQQQQNQEQQQDQQDEQEQQPTPSPSPAEGGAAPTPTPNPSSPVFAALDRAEAEARDQMRSPTPQASSVEKDW
jgi:Ca-activated chloride channel family protein